MARATGPVSLSSSGISAITGPRVISRNDNEAGYFVVLRKAKNAGIDGAPFAFGGGRMPWARITVEIETAQDQKEQMAVPPIAKQSRCLAGASSVRILPKAYPAAITPIQGMIEYSTTRLGPVLPKLDRTGVEAHVHNLPKPRERILIHRLNHFTQMESRRLCAAMMTTPIVPTTLTGSLIRGCHEDHATTDDPNDACHL